MKKSEAPGNDVSVEVAVLLRLKLSSLTNVQCNVVNVIPSPKFPTTDHNRPRGKKGEMESVASHDKNVPSNGASFERHERNIKEACVDAAPPSTARIAPTTPTTFKVAPMATTAASASTSSRVGNGSEAVEETVARSDREYEALCRSEIEQVALSVDADTEPDAEPSVEIVTVLVKKVVGVGDDDIEADSVLDIVFDNTDIVTSTVPVKLGETEGSLSLIVRVALHPLLTVGVPFSRCGKNIDRDKL